MSEIKISSLKALVEHLTAEGLRKATEAYKSFVVPTKLIATQFESRKQSNDFSTSNLFLFQVDGFTIKFHKDLEEDLASSKSVTISLFKADINNKPITWARITDFA